MTRIYWLNDFPEAATKHHCDQAAKLELQLQQYDRALAGAQPTWQQLSEMREVQIQLLAYTMEPIEGWVDTQLLKKQLATRLINSPKSEEPLAASVSPQTFMWLTGDKDATLAGATIHMNLEGGVAQISADPLLPPDVLIVKGSGVEVGTLTHLPPTVLADIPGCPELYDHIRLAGHTWATAAAGTVAALDEKPPWLDAWFGRHGGRHWMKIMNASLNQVNVFVERINELLEAQELSLSTGDYEKVERFQVDIIKTYANTLVYLEDWKRLWDPPAELIYDLDQVEAEAVRLIEQSPADCHLMVPPEVYAYLARKPEEVVSNPTLEAIHNQNFLRLDCWMERDTITAYGPDWGVLQTSFLPPKEMTDDEQASYKYNRTQGLGQREAIELTRDTFTFQAISRKQPILPTIGTKTGKAEGRPR